MSSTIERVNNGLQKLKSLAEGPSTLADRDKIVKQLKNDILFFNNLPPSYELDMRECILASTDYHYFAFNQFLLGDVYEYATFLSIEKQDIPAFERNISVLKTYYDECQ
jgi:hypothetical protein